MSNTQIEVIKFASFYNEGARGSCGGAAQNDKVWGVATVNGTLVNFWGRRNGKLRFKTFLKGQMNTVLNKYQEKIGGRTDGGDIYTPVNGPAMRDAICPNLSKSISHFFYSSMARGTLNISH